MRLLLITFALVAALAGMPALAGDHEPGEKHGGHAHRGHRAFCPHCGDACYPTVTKGKETKHCWDVETKAICIPKVRFPWEASCCDKGCGKAGCVPPKCGRTKYVNVLIKHEYECSTCNYRWDVDSYKYDHGTSDKSPADVEPARESLMVPDPPAAEASLPRSHRRVASITLEQNTPAAPAKKSYMEILTSFPLLGGQGN